MEHVSDQPAAIDQAPEASSVDQDQLNPIAANRHHNAPELGAFSLDESAKVEAALSAWGSLKKTFTQHWLVVGDGVLTLREKADRLGGRQTYKRMLEHAGLGELATDKQKATLTRLLHIARNRTAVLAWHNTLPGDLKVAWASPGSVFKHCPVFQKNKTAPEPKLTEKEQLRQSVARLEEENHKLKKDRGVDDERFKTTDNPEETAGTIYRMFVHQPAKVVRIANELLRLVDSGSTRSRVQRPSAQPAIQQQQNTTAEDR